MFIVATLSHDWHVGRNPTVGALRPTSERAPRLVRSVRHFGPCPSVSVLSPTRRSVPFGQCAQSDTSDRALRSVCSVRHVGACPSVSVLSPTRQSVHFGKCSQSARQSVPFGQCSQSDTSERALRSVLSVRTSERALRSVLSVRTSERALRSVLSVRTSERTLRSVCSVRHVGACPSVDVISECTHLIGWRAGGRQFSWQNHVSLLFTWLNPGNFIFFLKYLRLCASIDRALFSCLLLTAEKLRIVMVSLILWIPVSRKYSMALKGSQLWHWNRIENKVFQVHVSYRVLSIRIRGVSGQKVTEEEWLERSHCRSSRERQPHTLSELLFGTDCPADHSDLMFFCSNSDNDAKILSDLYQNLILCFFIFYILFCNYDRNNSMI